MAVRNYDEYVFADAYITSFAKNLMSWNDMIRLASCKNLQSAETVLQEFGYRESEELSGGDIDGFIKREQESLHDMIYSTVPSHEELAVYFLPSDYHNVKVCLKSEFLDMEPPEYMLMATGLESSRKTAGMIKERNYAFMPPEMKQAVAEAADLFGRGGDPQEIDIIMDKACFSQIADAAEKSGDDFLIGFVRLQIDINNIKSFMRLRQIGKAWPFFQKVFLEQGNISSRLLVTAYEEPYTQIAEKLEPYGFKNVMAEGGRSISETGDFSIFERLCDNCLMEYCRKAKYETFGPAPIAGYMYGKMTELSNLRVILTGIFIGSGQEQINEKLRDPYV